MLAAAQVACMGQQGLSQAGALSPPCPTWGVQQHNMGGSATQHGGFSNTTWGVQQHVRIRRKHSQHWSSAIGYWPR